MDLKGNSFKDLKEESDKLHQQYNDFKKYETFLTWVYYVFGGTSTVLLVISSIYHGSHTHISELSGMLDTTFYLTLIATIINTLIIFFKINEKTSIVHSYASDICDIRLDIQTFLQDEHTEDEIILFKKMILQIKKRLADREPPISPCVQGLC